MDSTVFEIAQDVCRISTFHPGSGIQFNQFLIKDDEIYRTRLYTNATLLRLAALQPKILAVMYGSTLRGDGAAAIKSLAQFLERTLAGRQ